MKRLILCISVMFVCGLGCTPKKVMTWNLKHSGYRSAGDISVTALLDQTGVDKAEVLEFCEAAIAFLESGSTTKHLFQVKIRELASAKFVDYIDALFVVIPNRVKLNDQIPPEVKDGLLSFLRDGAVHAVGLYKEEHRPSDDDST